MQKIPDILFLEHAGSEKVNGKYERTSDYLGRPRYRKEKKGIYEITFLDICCFVFLQLAFVILNVTDNML